MCFSKYYSGLITQMLYVQNSLIQLFVIFEWDTGTVLASHSETEVLMECIVLN